MDTNRKILSFVLMLCLSMSFFLSSCGSKETEDEMIDYDFSVFFGNMSDAIKVDSLLTEYEKSTGIKIKPIIISEDKNNSDELKSLLDDEDAPAAYAASAVNDSEWLSLGGFIADIQINYKGKKTNHIPSEVEGYGLVFDRAMFNEMFGKDVAKKLLKDLRKTDFYQWTRFVNATDDFIKERRSRNFSIGGNDYKYPEKKDDLASELNGVFAIAGADSNMYGNDLINTILPTVDMNAWKNVENETSESALKTLEPTLQTYIDGLDILTSYLSGEFSSGIRGSDFVNEDFYVAEKTEKMFMDGKSVFTISDSGDYERLKVLNAKKAQTLEFLPIKMPYDKNLNGKTISGAALDRSIPAKISSSFFVNAQSDKATQDEALKFIKWFVKEGTKWDDPLSISIKTYIEQGNYLKYNYTNRDLDAWKKEIFDEEGIRLFLKKEIWSDTQKSEMKLFMAEMWCER